MEIIIGDLLTVEGKKYITLEVLEYENDKYAFVNEVKNDEEVTQDYYIFKVLNDSIRVVVEDNLKNILIPKFQELLRKDIKELLVNE